MQVEVKSRLGAFEHIFIKTFKKSLDSIFSENLALKKKQFSSEIICSKMIGRLERKYLQTDWLLSLGIVYIKCMCCIAGKKSMTYMKRTAENRHTTVAVLALKDLQNKHTYQQAN